MKLTKEQGQRALARPRGVEVCDKCVQLLGSVRWARKDEPRGMVLESVQGRNQVAEFKDVHGVRDFA
jgi:hypothetical protein